MNDEVLRAAYARVLASRTPGSRKDCASPEALLAVAKRRGSEADRHATLDHVSRCVECRRDLDLLRAVQSTREPVARRLSTLAAAAAILVLGLPLASYYIRRTPPSDVERSTADITLVSPRGELRSPTAVTLVWRSVQSTEQYDVSIVGDDGSSVARESTRDTTLLLRAPLPAGHDYYWSVTAHLANGGERRSEPVKFRVEK